MSYDPALNDFFETIKSFITLSADSREALASVMKRSELPKGTVLVHPGSICKYIYYIEKGLTRTWYVKDGKDVTDWISVERTFATSIVSFVTGQPDIRGIELLEPAIIWAIGHDDIQRLYDSSHEIERFGRLLVSLGLVQMQQRFDELHFATARDRYRRLMEQHPGIIQRAPLGIIASYLGITQETLSRIRADFSF
ncbi:Crp/Fnr family transcriptional regulator [Chitinophaga sp. Mgbs1]|uniref:Crp/Fnr family transcriptional regulator n=1 Tax=Chitinophaga solisilvae TaxID=1233460 RepID=A0A9Q5D5B3_9BACT|nr:Crp/Fnr family transcriptional regulator [Chitinophaga solisilvae]